MTFTPTDKLLLSALLPTATNQQRLTELLSNSEIDWALAVRRSMAGGTAALLRWNLARAAVLGRVPKPEQELLEKESHSWAVRQQIYVAEATQLIEAFREKGIASLPLKGAALMLGEYYPLPGLRSAVDVDLLLPAEQAEAAFALAEARGYEKVEIKKPVRVAVPLAHELRHLPVLRGRSGVLLELHYRAFHDLRRHRDFGWAEMAERAVRRNDVLLPATEDLALHLIQHTIVDLTSAYAILRTLADLHFLFAAEPKARGRLLIRAEEFALSGAVNMALDALDCLEANTFEQAGAQARLLLETALMGSSQSLFETARLFEYLDLRQQPVARIKHLYQLLTLENAPQPSATVPSSGSLLNRVSAMWRRLHWKGVAWTDVRRVLAIRKITQSK
ncbi:MAG: nucleotidyltransferase family protein [Acidobacteria bacterium]|nr:nucleotidyltransferase family protein [Acidobacteriota bacterium]